jgi:hypothetical protein
MTDEDLRELLDLGVGDEPMKAAQELTRRSQLAPTGAPKVDKPAVPVTPKAPSTQSWKVEMTDGTGWSSNALRFATRAEAQAAGEDIFSRWLGAKDMRVVESDDPVSQRREHGENVRLEDQPAVPVTPNDDRTRPVPKAHQALEAREPEIRAEMAALEAKDSLTDQERAHLASLRGDLAVIEKRRTWRTSDSLKPAGSIPVTREDGERNSFRPTSDKLRQPEMAQRTAASKRS